jgi:hypothetical protein
MTSAFAKTPEKCVSAAFKDEKKLQDAVQRLLDLPIGSPHYWVFD